MIHKERKGKNMNKYKKIISIILVALIVLAMVGPTIAYIFM